MFLHHCRLRTGTNDILRNLSRLICESKLKVVYIILRAWDYGRLIKFVLETVRLGETFNSVEFNLVPHKIVLIMIKSNRILRQCED